MEEYVDVLKPPFFDKSGTTKPMKQAWKDGDWIGIFHLWIVQDFPTESLIYQVRGPNSSWCPNKFDVTCGGHYSEGESLFDGLREVKEELGLDYKIEDLRHIGRKINVSQDTLGNTRNTIMDITLIKDNRKLEEYVLENQPDEQVYAVSSLPIAELLKVHTVKDYSFEAQIFTYDRKWKKAIINKDSFPPSWDNYHYKMVLLAQRFLKGERSLIY